MIRRALGRRGATGERGVSVQWEQEDDTTALDPRTCAVLALGEAMLAERRAFANMVRGRATMKVWRVAQQHLDDAERHAYAYRDTQEETTT